MRFTRRRIRIMDYKNLTSNSPVCLQQQIGCAFFTQGRCTILNDTRFNRPCPFKKTITQLHEEKEKWSRK